MQTNRKLRVTVLCGGPSAEREVSLNSGKAVAEALQRVGHTVFVSDIGPEQTDALEMPADVVFPVLHGPFGEDGTVQRMMEARGLRYVGPDSRASALAMDKAATKRCVAAGGIDTPASELWDAERVARGGAANLPFPVFVKPVDQGSSVGSGVVKTPTEFLPFVKPVVARFGCVLVEQFIAGTELTVGLVGEQTLPPICIRPHEGFYDYHAKYVAGDTEYVFDAAPPEVLSRAQALSRRVFELVGCRHLSRVDWILDPGNKLWFLEINTLPGFTSHSLVPKAAARVGISFEQLCDRLVQMAFEEAR
jgi:D-alanine-D-alanine ligase